MKTIKITEEAHKNLIKVQIYFYELTGKKLTFSQIIERYFIGEYRDYDKSEK